MVYAETVWPGYMPALEPERSESPVAAVWPGDVAVQASDADLPADKSRWSGLWSGWACQGRLCDIKLAVERITAEGASVVYARGSELAGQPSERVDMLFQNGELHGTVRSGLQLLLRMRSHEPVVELMVRGADGPLAAGVLVQEGYLIEPVQRRIPTPFLEDDKPVSLEVLIFKPTGPGPFPLLVVNHGSTGSGDNPALFKSTWSSHSLARAFTEQGWLVAFPQRRGRGKSDGLYDEGFTKTRSAYTCQTKLSLVGLERALSDVAVAVDWLTALPQVDSKQVVIGGVSRGGMLASVYAGVQPQRFVGVINFVGGWMGEGCKTAEAINTTSFRRGAASSTPQLWLYADGDPYYSLAHSRKNFEAFVGAGGTGSFEVLAVPEGEDGHSIHSRVALWNGPMQAFLRQVARP